MGEPFWARLGRPDLGLSQSPERAQETPGRPQASGTSLEPSWAPSQSFERAPRRLQRGPRERAPQILSRASQKALESLV
eukprot:9270327-Pyramimonas_sp.AAC.1